MQHIIPSSEHLALGKAEIQELDSLKVHAAELALLPTSANEKRRREFALGRAAAHRALHILGYQGIDPILRRSDHSGRLPLWPAGFTGSISHSVDHALCLAARQPHYLSVGLDLEIIPTTLRKRDISPKIATSKELTWLDTFTSTERVLQTIKLFSAKEALYKAFFPLEGKDYGFQSAELELDSTGTNFTVTFIRQDRESKKIISKFKSVKVNVAEATFNQNRYIISWCLPELA